MGKTRDLFKKIRDTKGTFHAKVGSIKDRNGMDLTEAEDITGLPSQALAWPPRRSAGRRESGSQRPLLGEAREKPRGSHIMAR